VRQIIHETGRTLMCFVINKDGRPRHPLYIKGDAPLIPLERK
jgi:hypothetical protein